MGFNSTVVVMHDALGLIRQDPTFGKHLAEAIADRGFHKTHDVGALVGNNYYTNAAVVIESHHADSLLVVAVGGNTGRVLYRDHLSDTTTDLEIIRKLASNLGYYLVKKREK
jgi:hypothetical protein